LQWNERLCSTPFKYITYWILASLFVSSFNMQFALARTPTASRRHIILDTDPGVDDSFAILLALRSPDVAVDAITIVFGNVTVDIGVDVASG
jgi:Inosine-uridine preferring nucleoside hydrolase